jgi:hypothetical protein
MSYADAKISAPLFSQVAGRSPPARLDCLLQHVASNEDENREPRQHPDPHPEFFGFFHDDFLSSEVIVASSLLTSFFDRCFVNR